MADNELGGLALIAANYGADDQDPPVDEDNATQPSEERMEVESTSASHTDAQKSPQNSNNTQRARLSFKLSKHPSPVRRALFSGSQAADPPAQSFNNSQIAPAPRKFLTYGDRTRSAPAVLTNHVAPFPGLDNLGNTCYINSVLQVLYHAKEFRGHLNTANSLNGALFSLDAETAVGRPLFDGKNTRHVHIARDLINQFLDLFKEMDERYHKLSQLYAQHHELDLNTAIGAAIVPRPLMKALGAIDPQFGPGTEQQDVQEFIRVVLGHLDDADKTCTKVFSEVEHHIKRRKRSHSDMMGDVGEDSYDTNGYEQNGNGHKNGTNGYHSYTNHDEDRPFKKQRLDSGYDGALNRGTYHAHEHNGHSNGTTTPKLGSPLKKSVSSPGPETRLSYIERLFQGSSVNAIKCLDCENVSARSENFLDLSLTIQKGQNLLWSIAQFASSEQLRGDNKYSCENCRTHTEAVKSTKFGALPRVLTIHLKRFRHEMYSTEKINHHIPSPLYLRLDQWCEKTCKEKNAIYELFGIIFHQGSSMSYGHYFSYLKVKRPTKDEGSSNGRAVHIPGTDFFSTSEGSHDGSAAKEEHSWIHCDDETVTFKTEKEITNLFNTESKSSSTAYIMFYRSLDDEDLRCIDSTYLYKHLNKV